MTNPSNTEFKLNILNSMYFDVLVLPETHCLPNQTIALKDYKVYQHNRPNQANARKGSGGIAIALHKTLSLSHDVESVLKGED